jgi:hypothetical protein
MKTTNNSSGKIARGLQGMGTVTAEMVDERARELAVINGRELNQADIREAKRELLGLEDNLSEESEVENEREAGFLKNASNGGKRVTPVGPSDPEIQDQYLVQEGVDEAEHDTMLKGARAASNQE